MPVCACVCHARVWDIGGTVGIVLLEISNSMEPHPSVVLSYTSKLRPVTFYVWANESRWGFRPPQPYATPPWGASPGIAQPWVTQVQQDAMSNRQLHPTVSAKLTPLQHIIMIFNREPSLPGPCPRPRGRRWTPRFVFFVYLMWCDVCMLFNIWQCFVCSTISSLCLCIYELLASLLWLGVAGRGTRIGLHIVG